MVLKFEAWLSNQESREDEIGALARTPALREYVAKISKRSNDEHHEWVDIVIGLPDGHQVPVFNDAWREFRAAKEAANDVSD